MCKEEDEGELDLNPNPVWWIRHWSLNGEGEVSEECYRYKDFFIE